jgi:hypothetical protein
VRYNGIPHLCRLAEVDSLGDTLNHSLTGRAKVVRLEFDCCEAGRSRWKIGDASKAGGSVGKRDYASSVQEAIGRH